MEDSRDPAINKNLRLISIKGSAFSERCKFALDAAGLLDQVQLVNYTPYFGERKLKKQLGKYYASGKVTVPVLVFDDGSALPDSIEISKWAAKNSGGKLKLPDNDELARVVEIADKILNSARFRIFTKTATSGAVDRPSVPPPLRFLPTFVISYLYSKVAKYLLKKYYSGRDITMQSAYDDMRTGLQSLDALRVANGGEFMIGNEFTLADIVGACAIGLGAPLPHASSNQAPALASLRQEPELIEEFADLIKWRDTIYVARRRGFRQQRS